MVLCIMRVCTVKAIQHTCIHLVFRPQVSLEWTCVACAENGLDILHFDPHSFQCSRLQTPGPKRHVGHGYPGPLPVKRFDLEQGQMIDIAGRFNIFNFKCSHELCSCFCHHYTGCEKTIQKKYEKSFPLPSERFIFGMTFIICSNGLLYHFDTKHPWKAVSLARNVPRFQGLSNNQSAHVLWARVHVKNLKSGFFNRYGSNLLGGGDNGFIPIRRISVWSILRSLSYFSPNHFRNVASLIVRWPNNDIFSSRFGRCCAKHEQVPPGTCQRQGQSTSLNFGNEPAVRKTCALRRSPGSKVQRQSCSCGLI